MSTTRFFLRTKEQFRRAPVETKVMFGDGIVWYRSGELWQELTKHGIVPMKRFLPSELMAERGKARVLAYPLDGARASEEILAE